MNLDEHDAASAGMEHSVHGLGQLDSGRCEAGAAVTGERTSKAGEERGWSNAKYYTIDVLFSLSSQILLPRHHRSSPR